MRAEPELIKAQGEAFKLSRRFGIRDPCNLCLEDLAMAVGVVVIEGQLQGAEARLVKRGRQGLVRVRAGIAEIGRRRFAIAHELGHWFLHADATQLSVCLDKDIDRYLGSNEELEANAFASELLMPVRLVRERYRKDAIGLALVARAASELNSTFTAAAVKLVEVSKEPCLVVFSEDGVVRWWQRSPRSRLHLERRQRLSPDTAAHWVARGEDRSRSPERVAPEAWFGHVDGFEQIEVLEQSMRLGHYQTVVTILTVSE